MEEQSRQELFQKNRQTTQQKNSIQNFTELEEISYNEPLRNTGEINNKKIKKQQNISQIYEEKTKEQKPEPNFSLEPIQQPEPSIRPIIPINKIIKNKQAIKTFDKLFLPCTNPKVNNDANIKIRFVKIQSLFKALDQELDLSKGKGSHAKATLNLSVFGIQTSEIMITMSKTHKPFVGPALLKSLRETFQEMGLRPSEDNSVLRYNK